MARIPISVKVKNYKCFGEEEQGFEEILPVNLIIGRNNSGKSALLDMVKYVISPYDIGSFAHQNKYLPEVSLTKELTEPEVKLGFDEHTSGGGIPGNHFEYGKHFAGKKITFKLSPGPQNDFLGINADFAEPARGYFEQLARRLRNPFTGKSFARISAERDIKPEGSGTTGSIPALADDGNAATTILQMVVNQAKLDRAIVEKTLLDDLNRILDPDAHFERILLQARDDGAWEIFLEEKGKGIISLSNSGSGLKTIILVLIHMVVLPLINNTDLSNQIFAFEELENNLHPGIQRRLLRYIESKAVENGCTVFLATHSNVIIDMFSGNKNAQIVHVIHNGEFAEARRVTTYVQSKNILDDLDVRASDLLQTNGIIWVEGISDRIFIRHWIKLYCEERGIQTPLEGIHYSFIEYGGKCLSHYDFSAINEQQASDEDIELLIKALKICRNNYVVMDSDKSEEAAGIRETKERVQGECADTWLTQGREIENYVPESAVEEILGFKIDRFENIASAYKTKTGKTFDKKDFSLGAVERIKTDNWKTLDLEAQIVGLVTKIMQWNNPAK